MVFAWLLSNSGLGGGSFCINSQNTLANPSIGGNGGSRKSISSVIFQHAISYWIIVPHLNIQVAVMLITGGSMSEDCLAVGTMPLYYRCPSIYSMSNNSYSSMVLYQGIRVFFSNMVHKLGVEKL